MGLEVGDKVVVFTKWGCGSGGEPLQAGGQLALQALLQPRFAPEVMHAVHRHGFLANGFRGEVVAEQAY